MSLNERASTRLSFSSSDREGSTASLISESVEAKRQQSPGECDAGDLAPPSHFDAVTEASKVWVLQSGMRGGFDEHPP